MSSEQFINGSNTKLASPDAELGDKCLIDDGKAKVLEVINVLENSGISCCIVGTRALKYYGAHRATEDWELCVSTENLETAASLFRTEPLSEHYDPASPRHVQPHSLHHTFPLFKGKGLVVWIVLVPSWDCQIECIPENYERCSIGLPYLRLEVFAQSLVDTANGVNTADLVDGMDLSEEWGIENLRLEGPPDASWITKKNEAIRNSVPLTEISFILEVAETPRERKEFWRSIVERKTARIGMELSKEHYATRFRLKGSPDPRLPYEYDVEFFRSIGITLPQ